MRSLVVCLTITVLALAVTSVALADPIPSQKPLKATAKTMICPDCKMPMPTVKSAKFPVAVSIKGTTYYCCASCAASKTKKAEAEKSFEPATRVSQPTSMISTLQVPAKHETTRAVTASANLSAVIPMPQVSAKSQTLKHSDTLEARINTNVQTPILHENVPETNHKDSVPAQFQNPTLPPIPDNLKAVTIDVNLSIRVTLLASGKVQAKLVRSSGYPEIDKAALTNCELIKFKPATENGVPVDSVKMVNMYLTNKN